MGPQISVAIIPADISPVQRPGHSWRSVWSFQIRYRTSLGPTQWPQLHSFPTITCTMGLWNSRAVLWCRCAWSGYWTIWSLIRSHRYPSQSTIASATLFERVQAEENRVLSKHSVAGQYIVRHLQGPRNTRKIWQRRSGSALFTDHLDRIPCTHSGERSLKIVFLMKKCSKLFDSWVKKERWDFPHGRMPWILMLQ